MTLLPHCDTLALSVDGMTLSVTLNRPESRNAMSLGMVEELASVFTAIEADPAIRAVCLRGAGGHFCAGGDIRDMAGARAAAGTPGTDSDPFYRLNRAFGRMIQQVNESSKTVIAVLQGAVMGGGFGLACVSDLALAGPSARFGLPETSLGVIPAQIAPFVVERVGLTQARRLALLGQRFDGEEACRLGVVHQSFATDDELEAALGESIGQIRRCAPQASAITKALLHKVGQQPMATLLDEAALQFASAIRGPEGTEGTGAFMQKRPPAWAVTGDPDQD
ncbi:MAG: enoyl-CoA hydratase-related protein [Marinobacter sp.]|nr:enoyl-CoA hydratase-related protein [Marinobacter sp.]